MNYYTNSDSTCYNQIFQIRKMKTTKLLLGIPFLLAGCNSETAKNPNIILILTDDLGYNDISSYRKRNQLIFDHPSESETPNIDYIAENGVSFTQFYCGAAVCSPSRGAILTGRNSSRLGIYNWIPENSPMHLRDSEYTMGELFSSSGYNTAHFGKWHLTSEGTDQPLPEDQGYDYAFFTYNNALPSHHNPVNFIRHKEKAGELNGYSCQLVVNEALSWLDTHNEKNKPFYINVWFNEPHEKLAAPEEFTSRHSLNPKYYGAIENMDNAVGRLIDYLKANDLYDNTILIFSSDNGSQEKGSNDPHRGDKCFNFEGGIRVPFIVSWPDKVPGGQLCDVPGSFPDLFPTLSGICNLDMPEDKTMDGEDISELFMNPEQNFEREKPQFFYRYFHDPVCMLRQGDMVLLGYYEKMPLQNYYDAADNALLRPEPGEPKWSMWGFNQAHMEFIQKMKPRYYELYDIRKDPSQLNDIAADFPETVKSMTEQSEKLRIEMIAEGGNWYAGE